MKTRSHIYINKDKLTDFIECCSFNFENEISVQVFSARIDDEFISGILNEISESVPGAKILGNTTAGGIHKGKSIEGSCLFTITEFEKSIT